MKTGLRHTFLKLMLLGLLLGLPPASVASPAPAAGEPVMVFAASSLTDVLGEAGRAYTRRTGVAIRYSFASSSQLARQLEAGARADLVISADRQWMDHLEKRGMIAADSRRILAGNRLVVVTASTGTTPFDPKNVRDWRRTLGDGIWVTGDPGSVPLGRYTREALQGLGAWSMLEPRLARAENARAALALAARGEAAFGIVYATDAKGDPRVRILANLPENLHAPIDYPAALTRSGSTAAATYLRFLGSPEARRIFERHGFEPYFDGPSPSTSIK